MGNKKVRNLKQIKKTIRNWNKGYTYLYSTGERSFKQCMGISGYYLYRKLFVLILKRFLLNIWKHSKQFKLLLINSIILERFFIGFESGHLVSKRDGKSISIKVKKLENIHLSQNNFSKRAQINIKIYLLFYYQPQSNKELNKLINWRIRESGN